MDEWQKYVAMKPQLLALSRHNDTRSCASLMNGPMKEQFYRVTDKSTEMVDWNEKRGEATVGPPNRRMSRRVA